jgi:transcriptional regulator with GAF, ATPase, and Fis domain
MALNDFWHCFCGQIEDCKQIEITNLLLTAGVKTSEYNPDNFYQNDVCAAGIVFFDKVDLSFFNFLRIVSQQGLHRVITVSVEANLSSKEIWTLLQCGAADAFSLYHSSDVGNDIAARFEHWENVDKIIESPLVENNLIGKSPAWIKILRQIVEVARFTDASILITGESGTGKELIARLIHTLDGKRSKSNLVVLDCTTIVPELSGSEFFGHERGAFTGAVAQRKGAFALANQGTLFLDEVGELPLTLQAELLRVVQEHTYKQVGGNDWQKTDFRLICATNRNLLEQEERGNFRRDFYHRLATWTCHLPSLGSRVEDIPLLAQYFLGKICDGRKPPILDDVVSEYLIQRKYPGNVRELYQLIKRIVYHHVGDGPVTAGDIPESDRPKNNHETPEWRDEGFEKNIRRAVFLGIKLKDITHTIEESAEAAAIMEADGKVAVAAERLGIDKRTLQMHIKENKDKLRNVH